jgi:hypothetical protein
LQGRSRQLHVLLESSRKDAAAERERAEAAAKRDRLAALDARRGELIRGLERVVSPLLSQLAAADREARYLA